MAKEMRLLVKARAHLRDGTKRGDAERERIAIEAAKLRGFADVQAVAVQIASVLLTATPPHAQAAGEWLGEIPVSTSPALRESEDGELLFFS
jgi:hypothetical protein